MSMERYDRNSIMCLSMPTVNPCNNFIVDYLIRTKVKSDKQVSSKYYMYNLAIQSVRKYPLPLICQQQLAALEGFGNFFIKRVAKLMKKHYQRGRMPTEQEMEQEDREHLEGLRQNLKRLTQQKKEKQRRQRKQKNQLIKQDQKIHSQSENQNYGNRSEEDSSQDENQSIQQKKQKKQENIHKQRSMKTKSDGGKTDLTQKFQRIMSQSKSPNRLEKKQKKQKQEEGEQQSKQKEQNRLQKKRRNYRPRKGTQPFQILKAIIELQKQGKSPALKGDINQYMFNKRKQKMKGWTPVRDRLVQFGYLRVDPNNQDLVTITQKGKDYFFQVQQYGSEEEGNSAQSKSSQKKKQQRSNKSVSKKIKNENQSQSREQSKSKSHSESDNQDMSNGSIRSNSRSSSRSKSNQNGELSKSKPKNSQIGSNSKSQSKNTGRSHSSFNHHSYAKSKMRKIIQSSNRKQRLRKRSEQQIRKQKLTIGKIYKEPIIVFNTKSQINRNEEERIIQILTSMPDCFKFVEEELSIGEFAWQVGQSILDILLFRVKMENFDIDQYFLSCQRAKQCQCENVYFVFEDSFFKAKYPEGRQQLINSVLADSRVYGFKIIKTSGVQQTISFVLKLTEQLGKKIKALSSFSSVKPMFFLSSSIKQLNDRAKSYKPALIKNVGINCLRCILNITREMIKKIIKKMPGMWYVFSKLSRLKNDVERKQFLRWYLRQFNPKKGTIRLIVDILFFKNYDS